MATKKDPKAMFFFHSFGRPSRTLRNKQASLIVCLLVFFVSRKNEGCLFASKVGQNYMCPPDLEMVSFPYPSKAQPQHKDMTNTTQP
jgi:hypothetical protein